MGGVGVGGVAEAVAEQVEGQHRHDHEDRRDQHPRVQGHRLDVLRLVQQHPPAHHRRAQPQAQEAERRLAQDHARDRQGQVDDQVAQERGQQVAHDDLAFRRAGDLRRHHEVLLAGADQLAAHHPRQRRPADDRQDNGDAEIHPERRPVDRHRRRQCHPQRDGGYRVDGLRWITTLRAPTIRKLIANGEVAQSMFDERDLAEISSPDFPGERLIVCRNPVLADQRQRKRQELLVATEDKLAPIVKATGRAKEPLRGAADIGVRVGKVINQHKVSKHFLTTITDDSFSFERDHDKIATEAELDGLYIVRSNVEPELFDADQTVRAYKDLAKVERAFRSMKTVDLKVRPIYHRRADRVRAHVLLCMLAYYLEWHMRSALAPVLFDDHDRAAGEQQRSSVVQPAQRSPAAQKKAASKRTADDLPVHSFRSLIADLGTLTMNKMQLAVGGSTFSLPTQPTPLQQRCFELLGVSPRM